MIRNIAELTKKEFDLVIVGGGIFGVNAAWDAVSRGLSVAIIDKGDFSNATSANHFKMVHGGIRYLQHGDIIRIRESSRERSALLRIAPHLVKPLPIVIPTYGYGMKGKAILGAGILIYDLLTLDRNRGLHSDRRIPRGKFISRSQVLKIFPGIKQKGLTGAAVFYDGQMHNPPRIAISFLRAAVEKGVIAANYVEAIGILRNGSHVMGVKAKDIFDNKTFAIRGRCVLNAAGPWANRLLELNCGIRLPRRPTFSRDLAFVVNRSLGHGFALAFSTESKDSDTLVDRGGRHLFAVPWRDHTLIGVWHKVYKDSPDEIIVEPQEIEKYVREVNYAYPGIQIRIDEISLINTGLTLYGEEGQQIEGGMSFGKRSLLIDHESVHKLSGLVTLIGVRATTARGMAHKALNIIIKKDRAANRNPDTENSPIYGGGIESFEEELRNVDARYRTYLNKQQVTSLVANYGNKWPAVLRYAREEPSLYSPIGKSMTLKAEVIHAIREEMAFHLSDVVFRRTDLGTGHMPKKSELEICAHLMAAELGWDQDIIAREIDSAQKTFHTVNMHHR